MAVKHRWFVRAWLRPLLFLCPVALLAQVSALNNASVSGKFFFRHLEITTDTSGNITDSRGAIGTITFDGAGHYALNAQQTVGTLAAVSLTGEGSYSVTSSGSMSIGNPQRNSLSINARVGVEAIVGSTTESGDNTFDLFIAIPAATAAQATSGFSGTYYVSSLEFPLGVASYVRSAFFTLTPSANGLFSLVSGVGHALNASNGAITSVSLTGTTYAFNGDGTVSANFGSASNNIGGLKNLLVSASGNIVIGGSTVAGAQDFLIGVRSFSGNIALSNLSGLYYTGGLRYDAQYPTTAGYVGSSNVIPASSLAVTYQRLHQISSTPSALDDTGYQSVVLNTNGTYSVASFNALGLGPSGQSFSDADVATQQEPLGFSIDFGIAADSLSGSSVFINPQGILNGASFSPGQPVSPGEFVSIFGTNLAPSAAVASPPYPASLNGVTVTVNGIEAPIYSIASGQINALIPYGTTGSSAAFVVTNIGKASNQVIVPLTSTAPGVFTQSASGTGLGSILRPNNTVVTSSNPAKKGETISIYLTGLGAVNPSVNDGSIPPNSPLSYVSENVSVVIGNTTAKVLFAGLAPGTPGLYQINVTIPTSLNGTGTFPIAIETPEAFSEQATIVIQ